MNYQVYFLFVILGFVLTMPNGYSQSEYRIADAYRDEIKQLADRPEIQKAFEYIQENDDQTIRDLIHLTEIPAPPFLEMERALEMKRYFAVAGVDSIWIDEVGNVLAMRKGKQRRKTIAIDAHLDTVFPEETDVKVRVVNDTIFAPGVGDDTRGLAMLIQILRALNYAEIATDNDLLFIASVGEEGLGDLRGVKHLFRNGGPKIHSWVAIDGGQIGRVNNQALGSYRYRVTFHGPGGHSWGAFGMVNPHHALGKAIEIFVEAADAFTSYGARTSYNVGRIGGGTSINSVPFESWMEIDVRSIQPERLDSLEAILYNAVDQAVTDQNQRKRIGGQLTAEIDKIGDRPSGELSSDLPLIQRALASTAYFGKRPRLTRGSTNSNIPIALGIPAVTIGRGGSGANAHSLDEWWYNREGHLAIQLALLLVIAEAGLVD